MVPYAVAVDREVATLRHLVTGPSAPYLVVPAGQGCWRLDLRIAVAPQAAYGRRTTLCFDGVTGAVRMSTVDRGSIVDVTTADAVRSVVTDADLRLPA